METPGGATDSAAAAAATQAPRADLRLVRRRFAPVSQAGERTLPVLVCLQGLFPGGALQRGWVIAITGTGMTSLALAVAAGASAAGSWTAVVDDPELGLSAAAEVGIALERLLLISTTPSATASAASASAATTPTAGPGTPAEVLAALVGLVDIVLVGPAVRLRPVEQRRLAARLREGGSVLIRTGGGGSEEADVRLRVAAGRWHGLLHGSGLLRSRHVSVHSGGRRAAAAPRWVELLLPGPEGAPVLVQPSTEAGLPAGDFRPAVAEVHVA